MRFFQPYSVFDFQVISAGGPNCGFIAESLLNTAAPLPAAVLSASPGDNMSSFSLPNQLDVIQKAGTRITFPPRHQLSLVADKPQAL